MTQEAEIARARTSRNFIIAVYCAQFFFGGWFVAHGLNQWLEFFPRPKGSSPVARELIMALNHSGLFDFIKIMEVVTGVMLLLNRFVPLAVVLSFPTALSIAHLNLMINPDLTSKIVGVAIMLILGLIALGRLDRFLPMLVYDAGHPSDAGLRQLFAPRVRGDRPGLRPVTQLLAIVAGIAAPVALTFCSTSDAGPRSAGQAAEIAAATLAPREVVEQYLALSRTDPQAAAGQFLAPGAILHHGRSGEGATPAPSAARDAGNSRIVAEEDMVAVHYTGESGALSGSQLFRVAEGRIVELWITAPAEQLAS